MESIINQPFDVMTENSSDKNREIEVNRIDSSAISINRTKAEKVANVQIEETKSLNPKESEIEIVDEISIESSTRTQPKENAKAKAKARARAKARAKARARARNPLFAFFKKNSRTRYFTFYIYFQIKTRDFRYNEMYIFYIVFLGKQNKLMLRFLMFKSVQLYIHHTSCQKPRQG